MGLKSFFNAAVQPVSRFLENLEIQALEARKQTAQAGFIIVPTRVGPVTSPLSPEAAASTVKACDERLARIHEKRAMSLK